MEDPHFPRGRGPWSSGARAQLAFLSRSLQGPVPRPLPNRTLRVTPHTTQNGPRLLPRRPWSPEPQEFSPHPDSAPWSRRPLAAPGRLSPGIPAPRTPGSLTLPPRPGCCSCLPLGPCGPASPEGCSALSTRARFRQAVEAPPPEAAAAGAGESRSRSQRAGASAPFPGCGVIHPARPGGT